MRSRRMASTAAVAGVADAASVICISRIRTGIAYDHHHRYRVLYVKRPSHADSFANRVVFPGGKVDAQDGITGVQGVDRFKVCAARELFEETGLLLGADGCQVGSDDVRRDVIDGRVPFQSLQPSWAHLADQLRPWSNWITPVSERRRFNTMFFLANVDPDVAAKASLLDQSGDGELIDLSWWTPSEALQAYSSWEVKMAPPQIYIMHELLHKETIDEVYRHIGRGHPIKPILPRIERLSPEYTAVLLPGDQIYDPKADWDEMDYKSWHRVVIHESDPSQTRVIVGPLLSNL
ncbi:Nudix hydrolase domain-containing protein [Plasmodiophora brassicae]